jgi:hypothetical protein
MTVQLLRPSQVDYRDMKNDDPPDCDWHPGYVAVAEVTWDAQHHPTGLAYVCEECRPDVTNTAVEDTPIDSMVTVTFYRPSMPAAAPLAVAA